MRSLTVLPVGEQPARILRASLAMLELKPPARPRSPVMTMSRCTSSLPVPTSSGGAARRSVTRAPRLAITGPCARHRDARPSAASCARRSFAAATICIALVILRVAFTERDAVAEIF